MDLFNNLIYYVFQSPWIALFCFIMIFAYFSIQYGISSKFLIYFLLLFISWFGYMYVSPIFLVLAVIVATISLIKKAREGGYMN